MLRAVHRSVVLRVCHPPWGGMPLAMGAHHERVANRLKTARGHLGWVIRLVEQEAYCPDVMKQLSAVQGMLEAASREVLHKHLSTCVAKAMREGRVQEIVDELMEALKYDKRVFAPSPAAGMEDPAETGNEG